MAEVIVVNGKRIATPEYRSWQSLKNRCSNPRCKDYPFYGGRGIGFAPEWEQFSGFLADMGRRPSPLHTIDRVDSEGEYCKSNCRWATREEQARNRPYAKAKAWVLAERLSVSTKTAHHYIWRVRARAKGHLEGTELSSEISQQVIDFMKEYELWT